MKDFSNIFDHNAQGYKFYWFESIIDILPQKSEMTFKEIMCKMIWKAWFSVTEYHLHLGPTREGQQANLIEGLVVKIEKIPGVKQPMTEEQLNRVIDDNFDLLRDDFNKLSTNVPYRLLSPFIKNPDGDFSAENPEPQRMHPAAVGAAALGGNRTETKSRTCRQRRW